MLVRPASRLAVAEWVGYANTAQFQEGLEAALAIARELRAERWIGHNQQLGVIAPAAQRWTTDDWWPRFVQLPLRRVGIVVSQDAFGKLATERIVTRASAISPFDTQYFPGFPEALQWVHASARGDS